ncbi:hypothetical protein [Niallia sp. FSL R7-0271]|uniref:hypothetical protein n=1 Tax=Niallia sp. FSL R7-0271 TaxID=2921678 RepID=UPI0030F6E9A9
MENLNGKVFLLSAQDSSLYYLNDSIFHYTQDKDIVTATFYSKSIYYGELVGLVNKTGILHVIFNFFCKDSTFHSGTCDFVESRVADCFILCGKLTIACENQITKEIKLQEIRINTK